MVKNKPKPSLKYSSHWLAISLFMFLISAVYLIVIPPKNSLNIILFFVLLYIFILSLSLIFLQKIKNNLLITTYFFLLPVMLFFNLFSLLNFVLLTLLFLALFFLFRPFTPWQLLAVVLLYC
jgi:hypothetical protein